MVKRSTFRDVPTPEAISWRSTPSVAWATCWTAREHFPTVPGGAADAGCRDTRTSPIQASCRTLLGVLALTVTLCVKTGVAVARLHPIPIKKHGRRAWSLFALGLAGVRKIAASADPAQTIIFFQQLLSPKLRSSGCARSCRLRGLELAQVRTRHLADASATCAEANRHAALMTRALRDALESELENHRGLEAAYRTVILDRGLANEAVDLTHFGVGESGVGLGERHEYAFCALAVPERESIVAIYAGAAAMTSLRIDHNRVDAHRIELPPMLA